MTSRKVQHLTLEHENGVTAPRRESFRAYASAAESFGDYVQLISTAERYAGALEHGGSAEAYARGVTEAGYATDPAYADKWLAIYNGERLAQALRELAFSAPAPAPPDPRSQALQAALREGLESLARAEGLDPVALLAAPPRRDPSSIAFCPRCHVEFARADAVCSDCGGIPVSSHARGT